MLDEPKYWISLIVGLVVIALGGIPILQEWGVLIFTLPGIQLLTWNILLWITAGVGAYLLIDSFISEDDTMMWISVLIAVVILAVTIVQILNNFGVIPFSIPFLSLGVLRILFVIEGFGLLIAAFGSK